VHQKLRKESEETALRMLKENQYTQRDEEQTHTLAIGLPAFPFLSDWQIVSWTAAPQPVQSIERPIAVMRRTASGILGNGGEIKAMASTSG